MPDAGPLSPLPGWLWVLLQSMVPFMWAHCVLDMPRLAMVSLTVLLPYGMAGLDDQHPLVFVRYVYHPFHFPDPPLSASPAHSMPYGAH